METTFKKRYKMGIVDGKSVFLSAPSWDCGWYWGFGYLKNKDCHYHLNGLDSKKNLYDAVKEHFGESLTIRESDLWTFCELVKTFYTLKETAEVLMRGGSHYTKNPCENVIKNPQEVKRINEIVLPKIFDEINTILKKTI